METNIAEALGEIAKKHGKQMAAEIVVEILEPALKEVVAKSETPVDDVIAAALLPTLKAELLKLIEKI